MTFRTPPPDPNLVALNERCQVSVENLIHLGYRKEAIFFTARTAEGYTYHAFGVARGLVNEHNENFWTPGNSGTPRFWISAGHEFFIAVTHLDGWTLRSAYPSLTLEEYPEHYRRVKAAAVNEDSPAPATEPGPFDTWQDRVLATASLLPDDFSIDSFDSLSDLDKVKLVLIVRNIKAAFDE